ncbi:MAG: glycoside hydrolase family 57 [Candidatus Omnitrophota bacterium]
MEHIFYALGLHMHQPPDNLALLIETNDWEAQQIIKCYERAARYAHQYKDVACFHIGFSGVLLAQFLDPKIVDRYRKYVDIPQMLEMYRSAKNIEIIGMGFYHPLFPVIPKEDWDEQLKQGKEIVEKIFHQSPKGFWPSEMAFSMEMIPSLQKAGYTYAVIDHVHVKPKDPNQKMDCFAPYKARFENAQITIIPRNRDLSNAQESGLSEKWFLTESAKKIQECPSTQTRRLITTWSDGENGGWFRQIDEAAGFFGYFFAPLAQAIREKRTNLQFIKISDFIKNTPKMDEAIVRTGAWNVASTSGFDFSQWNGSESQKKAINALFETSKKYWNTVNQKGSLRIDQRARLRKAHQIILDAETSCYLFWGDAWIPKIYEKLNHANQLLS